MIPTTQALSLPDTDEEPTPVTPSTRTKIGHLLVWEDDKGDKLIYGLYDGENTIGRAETSSVVVDNGVVSENHAQISYSDGVFIFMDVGSTNGSNVGATPYFQKVTTAAAGTGTAAVQSQAKKLNPFKPVVLKFKDMFFVADVSFLGSF